MNDHPGISHPGISATVLGATGLVGGELLRQLQEDSRVHHITSVGRRPLPVDFSKVTHRLLDFENQEDYARLIGGDVLFSALGTTLKAAGSKSAQWRVDHDYQLWAARAAANNGTSTYVLVSSVGAHPEAGVFYSRMKGQLEQAVRELPFSRIRILRPGILDGDRKENRPGERVALSLLRAIPSWSLPALLRPVSISLVARACRLAAEDPTPGVSIWEARDILGAGEHGEKG